MANNPALPPAKMGQARLGIRYVPCEPCTCEATPGNTELSNRGIIDKDKHPVAETMRFLEVCVRCIPITITSVHPVRHI